LQSCPNPPPNLSPSDAATKSIAEPTACPARFLKLDCANEIAAAKENERSFFGGVTGLLIVLGTSAVIAQTQPSTPPLPPLPRLTLTAQDEYVIRENLLKDTGLPRQRSGPVTIGDVVPQNIKLDPLPSEIAQKVPKAKAHQFFVKDDDTVVLVSPSDRRVADVIKKKPSD
jgi:hypothetical protein